MFTHLKLTNFAAFASLDWPDHTAMNVIIGENDTGKTHLLKILYALGRGTNEFHKKKAGPQPLPWIALLIKKLNWTFQPHGSALSALIRRGQESSSFQCLLEGCKIAVEIPNNTNMLANAPNIPSIGSTVFIPAKEILTVMQAIEATRNRMEIAGFDDTYLDLIKDYRAALTYGKIESGLNNIPDKIKKILNGGEIIEKGLEFVFRRDDEEYSMSQTAEGFKKIGIISRLIRNRSITKGSILLVDEPETNLHPKAIIAMADILFDLSQAGVQVYAATHSYFFLKRIEQRARKTKEGKTSLVDLRRSDKGVTATFHDLRDEIPDNPIFAQSEYLLNEDIRLDWGE